MRWTLTHGDIFDVPADVLVCSGNVYLNLSGGVGGEILRRFGDAMQRELHAWLAGRNLRFAAGPPVTSTGGVMEGAEGKTLAISLRASLPTGTRSWPLRSDRHITPLVLVTGGHPRASEECGNSRDGLITTDATSVVPWSFGARRTG